MKRRLTRVGCSNTVCHPYSIIFVLQYFEPFSGIYKTHESLAPFTIGNSTAAGAGGSRGDWSLSVVDSQGKAAG